MPGDRLADRYRIIGPLGAGGMATVHRALDERLERDVALKVLLPNHAADPAIALRFDREARAMAAATHPGVVAVFDVEPGDPATGREPFFVMELCPGGSLATRIGDGRRLSPDELIPILVSVADGLDGLHRAGLVHRDIKPSNILFAADRAKLGDLGLAQPELDVGSAAATAPGTAVGTLAYLAPELLGGERAGPAADVFALATVAFLGLTGQVPRPASSVADIVRTRDTAAPLVSAVAPELGTAFDAAMAAALSPSAADRPDALGFGAALTGALGRWARSGRPGAIGWIAAPAAATEIGASAIGRLPHSGPTETGTMGDATTALAMPLGGTAAIPFPDEAAAWPSGPAAAFAPGAAARPTSASAGSRRLAAVLILLVAAAAIAGGAFSGLLGAGGPRSSSAGPSRVGAGAASITPPSASPASLRPASVRPSPTVDPALAALDALDAAISAARGGPDGLKGKEANDLSALVAKVRRDVQADDRVAARKDAGALADRVRKATEKLRAEDRARLRDASAAVVRAVGG